jgi:hypothetical protein
MLYLCTKNPPCKAATENDFITPDYKNDTWNRMKCTLPVFVSVTKRVR